MGAILDVYSFDWSRQDWLDNLQMYIVFLFIARRLRESTEQELRDQKREYWLVDNYKLF